MNETIAILLLGALLIGAITVLSMTEEGEWLQESVGAEGLILGVIFIIFLPVIMVSYYKFISKSI